MSPIHPIIATDLVAERRRGLEADARRAHWAISASRPARTRPRRVRVFGRTRLAPC